MNKTNFSLNFLNSLPIIIIAFFLFSFVFWLAILWPKYQDFRALDKMIGEKEEELQQEEQYFSNLNQIKTELENYEEALSKINSAFPDDPSLPALFSFLQKASSQSGLILKGISPFASYISESMPNIKETQFSLQVSGSYSSFKEFVSILEKSARKIEVENISFFSPKEGSLFLFNLGLKIHSY